MEQIKIIFFVLASFFGIEDGRIFADKTTVTVNPEKKEIKIIQEKLFTIIQSEKDSALVLEQWNKLYYQEKRKTSWAKELGGFTSKKNIFKHLEDSIQSHLILSYTKEKDLRALGIWYDADKNKFSINHIPKYNIKTKNGKLTGNYWNFNGSNTFSFTIEPFSQGSENYQKLKIPLNKLFIENR